MEQPKRTLRRFSLLTLILLVLLIGGVYGLWRKRNPWISERVPQISNGNWIEQFSGPYCYTIANDKLSLCAPRQNLLIHGIPAGAGCVALSPDGRRILTLKPGQLSAGILTDVASNTPVAELSHATDMESAAFSPDSKRLATFSKDGVLKIWDTTSGALQEELPPAPGRKLGVDVSLYFSQSGQRLAVSYYPSEDEDEGGVRIWDSAAHKIVSEYTGMVWNFHGSDERILTNKSGKTGLLTLSDGSFIEIPGYPTGLWFIGHRIAPDGKEFFAGEAYGTARRWNAVTGASQVADTPDEIFLGFSPENMRMLSRTNFKDASATRSRVNIRDRKSGALLFQGIEFGGARYGISGIYSDDYERFVSDEDGSIELFDTRKGTQIATLMENPSRTSFGDEVRQFVFSPSRDRIYYYSASDLYIITRCHPEAWWGLACVPEFWLTLVVAVSLVRNFRRQSTSHDHK